MRNMKKLLIILLDYIPTYMVEKKYCTGLCSLIGTLFDTEVITYDEAWDLNDFIDHNMPKDYSTFLSKPGIWGWKPGDAEARIKWVKLQIEML